MRLWYVPIEQVLLRRSECSGVFQNGSFAPSPAGNKRDFFSPHIHRGPGRAPRGKTHQLAGPPDDLVPLEIVTCVAAHAERRAVCQLPLRLSCPDPGSAYRFCSGRL